MKKTANLWMGFDDRAQSGANNSAVFRALGDPSVRDIFKHHNPSGPRSYELWSLYYEVETEQELRDIRNDLNAEFPGQVRTIGAFWWDGRQVGTEWELDENGERVFHIEIDDEGQEEIIWHTTGQSIFPLHTSILEYMPDIDGSPATELTDVNLGQGQTPRIFV